MFSTLWRRPAPWLRAKPNASNGWFQGLGLGYGDTVYVDGGYAHGARGEVAEGCRPLRHAGHRRCAGHRRWSPARPGLRGRQPPPCRGPGLPNWSGLPQPDWDNHNMSNFGCGVNSNIAAMVANPEDLLHGREARRALCDAQHQAIVDVSQLTAHRRRAGQASLKYISTTAREASDERSVPGTRGSA